MTTIAVPFSIDFNRFTKDYDVTVAGEYIGSAATYDAGEHMAKRHIGDLINDGMVGPADLDAAEPAPADCCQDALPAATCERGDCLALATRTDRYGYHFCGTCYIDLYPAPISSRASADTARRVWAAITANPSMTVREIADVVHISFSYAHVALQRLEACGYITRTPGIPRSCVVRVPFYDTAA